MLCSETGCFVTCINVEKLVFYATCDLKRYVCLLSVAPSDGSITMGLGEDFSIVEQDQGDGWTRVRRTTGEEGFVPTSYIECRFYSQS
jgi:SH3 domain